MKNVGKMLLGIALGIAVVAAPIALLLHYFLPWSMETKVRHYGSVEELRAFAGTNDWWVPKFLPPSSYDIREKENFDYNTGRVALKFSASDYPGISARLSDAPPSEWEMITPRWGSGVLPRGLIRGGFATLTNKGFRIAAVTNSSGKRPWYVAVDSKNGVMYAWNINK